MSQSPSTVLITGSARRIGRAIALHCVEQGMRVILHYHQSENDLQSLVDACRARAPDSVLDTLRADLSDPKALASLCQHIRQHHSVEVLINNASRFYPTPLARASDHDWDDLMSSNVRAAYRLSQAFARDWRPAYGNIINITDYFAEHPLKHYSLYAMAKAAWRAMTMNLAVELAPKIRVNAIAPGAILLPETTTEDSPASLLSPASNCALHRLGNPLDIAHAALFLLENPYITGQTLHVDGGRSPFTLD